MSAVTAVYDAARVSTHFAHRRAVDVLVLQASPLLGAAFGAGPRALAPGPLLNLFLASLLLTAHVFAFNDWAGQLGDLNDPRRGPQVFLQRGISSRAMAGLAVALLALAMVGFAALGFRAVVLGAAIACLGLMYSCSSAGKGVPGLASLLHLSGGALHFLLGYSIDRPVDARGLTIAVFFGLVFAGGHLNQEVRDHETDRRNGIRTTAAIFGPRAALLASIALFSAAHAELALLAALGVVPRQMLWAVLVWPLQLAWTWRALRNPQGFDEARRLQRRYRLLFGYVGVVILLAIATGR